MTYKDVLTLGMEELASDPRVRFVGYNTAYGPRMNGTLANVPKEKCVETPVAENLMVGIAIGLALEGFFPVLCFERFDFCLAAADALVNEIGGLKPYGLKVPMLIRVIVGNDKPLDPGWQHRGEYTELLGKSLVVFEMGLSDVKDYALALQTQQSVVLVERRALYERDIPTP